MCVLSLQIKIAVRRPKRGGSEMHNKGSTRTDEISRCQEISVALAKYPDDLQPQLHDKWVFFFLRGGGRSKHASCFFAQIQLSSRSVASSAIAAAVCLSA